VVTWRAMLPLVGSLVCVCVCCGCRQSMAAVSGSVGVAVVSRMVVGREMLLIVYDAN